MFPLVATFYWLRCRRREVRYPFLRRRQMARTAIGVLRACCLGAIAVLSSSAFATQSESLTRPELAAIDATVLQRDLATLAAPIRSEHSLSRHLSAGLAESPLRYLSQPALRRFLASLEFNAL